jgi:hypothetical protein
MKMAKSTQRVSYGIDDRVHGGASVLGSPHRLQGLPSPNLIAYTDYVTNAVA